MMTTPALSCHGIELRRDGVPVLRLERWDVAPGERWVVMGHNGCGKTSLVLALMGRLHPWDGDISILGLTSGADDIQPLRTRIGFSGDALEPLLDPGIDCLDLVSTAFVGTLGLRFDRPTRAQIERSRNELSQWGLAGMERRPLSRLSMGQRRRAWLSRALAPDPSLLILDEPCAGLDPAAREDLVENLDALSLRRPDLPIVLVTHHVEEIPASFTHALLLAKGCVLSQGRLPRTLNEGAMASMFGRPFRLVRRDGRLRLR
jgi:iron complex transport system ATP-binding protein